MAGRLKHEQLEHLAPGQNGHRLDSQILVIALLGEIDCHTSLHVIKRLVGSDSQRFFAQGHVGTNLARVDPDLRVDILCDEASGEFLLLHAQEGLVELLKLLHWPGYPPLLLFPSLL